MTLFSTDDPPDSIPTPSDNDEIQSLRETAGTLRQEIRSDLQSARTHEAKAREAEDQAAAGGDVALVDGAVDHTEKADALRKRAREKRKELREAEDRLDELEADVEAEGKRAFDEVHAEALREAAEATEQAIQAHRRLRSLETEYKQFLELVPRYPLAKDWCYKTGAGSAEQFVNRAREIAAEKG